MFNKFIVLIGLSLAFFSSSICSAGYRVVEIPELLGADYSEIVSISDGRWICGYFVANCYVNGAQQRNEIIFVWHPDLGYREVKDLPPDARPVAINDSGHMVGRFDRCGKERGFFWCPSAGFREITGINGNAIHVTGLNNHNQVVGRASTGNQTSLRGYNREAEVAFLWDAGLLTLLPPLKGPDNISGENSGAIAINDSKWVPWILLLRAPV